MLNRSIKQCGPIAALAVAILAAAGCGGHETHTDQAAPAVDTPTAVEQVKANMEATLARADQVDGDEDQVVSKCPGCALTMDGSEEHTLTVSGYELHFCSDHCKEGFAEDPAKSLLTMQLPEE